MLRFSVLIQSFIAIGLQLLTYFLRKRSSKRTTKRSWKNTSKACLLKKIRAVRSNKKIKLLIKYPSSKIKSRPLGYL